VYVQLIKKSKGKFKLCVILSDMTVKITVIWDITSCSWMNRYRWFGGTSLLHLLTVRKGGSMFH